MNATEMVKAGRWKFPVNSLCKAAEIVEGLHNLYLAAQENPEEYVNHENRTCAGIARHTLLLRKHHAKA